MRLSLENDVKAVDGTTAANMPRGISKARFRSIPTESLHVGTFSIRSPFAANQSSIPELAGSIAAS
jgi:hypothetical protein